MQCVSGFPLNEVEFRFSFRTGDNMDVSKTVRRIAIFGELNETESSAIAD